MGTDQQDLVTCARLRQIVRRNLNLELEYIGLLNKDDAVQRSVRQHEPLLLLEPISRFSRCIEKITYKIFELDPSAGPKLFEGNEDLAELSRIE